MFRSLEDFIRNDSLKGRKKKWFITTLIFLILVSLAVIVIPWRETWNTILNSNLALIAYAVILHIPTQLLSTASYYVVSSQQQVSQKFWTIFKINIIMIFYNIVLPSTFFVSGLRWYRYNQHSKKPAEIFTSIAYLKAFKILFAIVLSIGLLLFFRTTTYEGSILSGLALIILLTLILFFTPLISKKILSKIPAPRSSSNNVIAGSTFYLLMHKVLSAFANFQALPIKTQLILVFYELVSQAIQYYSYILIAESVGINLSLAQLGGIRAILLLIANLPINFSVGISLRDVTLVSLLAAINIPMEQAAAMSIVVMAKNYLYGMIGGIIEAVGLIIQRRRVVR